MAMVNAIVDRVIGKLDEIHETLRRIEQYQLERDGND